MQNKIGIIGAMPAEIAKLEENVQEKKVHKHNDLLTFVEGKIGKKEVVYAASNVGQNFASSVVTTLINQYHARKAILFTGIAGGLKENLQIGDVVVATDTINYNMNVKSYKLPWDPSYQHKIGELPFLKLREFKSDQRLVDLALQAPLKPGVRRVLGRVVSGSELITTERKKELSDLWEELDFPEAVEMEGAAVGQICHVYGVPFLLLRAISDNLKGDASDDINAFTQDAANNLWPIVEHTVLNLED